MSKMRRASFSLQSQTSEPLIVVDESDALEYEATKSEHSSDNESACDEESGHFMNPYLLSPWRDSRETRKHSLPTPQCIGITASQVRRLSERGEGSTSPGPRQTEFLATLSSAPAPVAGGRRHSVVTISKVPVTLFGRSRRESVAQFGSPSRILQSRRESIVGPPSTEPRGSVHNLQLDIMDDIVQARKVRMKLWTTSSEKVCEVQPLDEAGGVQKYSSSSLRRYSDFVGTTLAPIPSCSKRRASELPPPGPSFPESSKESKKSTIGIVCSNTDLISILSSLTSSATEINQTDTNKSDKKLTLEESRSRMKTNRSNSFDVSILHATGNKQQPTDRKEPGPSNWFVKRHQPMSSKNETQTCMNVPKIKFSLEKETSKNKEVKNKVVWDGKSGSIVDAQILGNAIEDFLRRDSNDGSVASTSSAISPNKGAIPKKPSGNKSKSSWFSSKVEDESNETCDSSICSTLKDLFVK